MNATAHLQRLFQAFVVDGTGEIMPAIVDGPRAGADRRLAIYANAYRSRLAEVLDSDFPALHALARDELFRDIAHAYAAAYPSTQPNARWFGRHLLSFLRGDDRFSGHCALIEMAAFEWAMSLAFDAADDATFSFEQLSQVPADDWPALQFGKHASLQCFELTTNVPAYWLAVQRSHEPPQISTTEQASSWIVWRRELTVFYRSLEEDETWAIDAAFRGQTFAELCVGLEQWHSPADVPLRAAQLLKRWVEEGLILRRGTSAQVQT